MDEIKLTWIGPTGHVSPTYGELIPGKQYPIPESWVDAFLKDADCWQRPTAPKPKAAKE